MVFISSYFFIHFFLPLFLFISDVELNFYNGMGHSSCPQEMRDMAKFIARTIPPIETAK